MYLCLWYYASNRIVHRHNNLVLPSNLQHLLAYDDPCKGLAYVLHNLSAVYPIRHSCFTPLCIVHHLRLAVIICYHAQVRIAYIQAVRQPDTLLTLNEQHAVPAKRCRLVLHDGFQCVASLPPELRDLWVLVSVHGNNALCLLQWHLHLERLKLSLELSRTHAIPCT